MDETIWPAIINYSTDINHFYLLRTPRSLAVTILKTYFSAEIDRQISSRELLKCYMNLIPTSLLSSDHSSPSKCKRRQLKCTYKMYEDFGRLMTHIFKWSIMWLKPLMVVKFIVKRSQNKINNWLVRDVFYFISNRSYLVCVKGYLTC